MSRSRSRSATSICASAAPAAARPGENGEARARAPSSSCSRPSASPSSRPRSSCCSPSPSTASASAPRPTSTASPTGAGRGSSTSRPRPRNGRVAATFPVAETDQVMLVTDQGQTIRIPVHDIRIAGRNTQGVKLFTTGRRAHRLGGPPGGRRRRGGRRGRRRGVTAAGSQLRARRARCRRDRPRMRLASGTRGEEPADEPDTHRDLSGHVRPDPHRPSRRDPAGDDAGRPADRRRRDQCRQGPAVHAGRAHAHGRDRHQRADGRQRAQRGT